MKNAQSTSKNFIYLKPRKVNGGVGAKKQSIHHTPIRLSGVSRNMMSDYTGNSSITQNSHSKLPLSKVPVKSKEMTQIKPKMSIKSNIGISTPSTVGRDIDYSKLNKAGLLIN